MKVSDVKDVLIIAAILAAAYYVYKIVKGGAGALDSLSTGIAQGVVGQGAQLSDSITNRTIVLPNGVSLKVGDVTIGSGLMFSYLGKQYKIDSRTGDVYNAVTV